MGWQHAEREKLLVHRMSEKGWTSKVYIMNSNNSTAINKWIYFIPIFFYSRRKQTTHNPSSQQLLEGYSTIVLTVRVVVGRLWNVFILHDWTPLSSGSAFPPETTPLRSASECDCFDCLVLVESCTGCFSVTGLFRTACRPRDSLMLCVARSSF